MVILAAEGVDLIDSLESAGALVARISAEAEAKLRFGATLCTVGLIVAATVGGTAAICEQHTFSERSVHNGTPHVSGYHQRADAKEKGAGARNSQRVSRIRAARL